MIRIIEPIVIFVIYIFALLFLLTLISSMIPNEVYSKAFLDTRIFVIAASSLLFIETYTYFRFGDPIIFVFDRARTEDSGFPYYLLIGVISFTVTLTIIFMTIDICVRYPDTDIIPLIVCCIPVLILTVWCGTKIRGARKA